MVPMIVCYGYFPQGPHVSCYGSVQGSAASLQLIFVELIIRFRNSGGLQTISVFGDQGCLSNLLGQLKLYLSNEGTLRGILAFCFAKTLKQQVLRAP